MKLFEFVFFAVCSLLVLGGGVVTVAALSPIRGAMGLFATIVGIAGMYLGLHAELLAAVQILVYAGAVVVLFLFVIMLLGSAAIAPRDARTSLPRYLGAAVFALAATAALVTVHRSLGRGTTALPAVAVDFGTIEGVGRHMFTADVVPFELAGALLLVAVVGAIAVARGRQADPTPGAALSEATEPVARRGGPAAASDRGPAP